VLESLLTGGDEASVMALATLRSGATYWVADGAQPAGAHAGVFKRRLQRMRMHGFEPLGLERAVRLVRAQGRPVRTGLIDAADRAWTTLLFLTEDGSALVACAGWPLPLVARKPPLQEFDRSSTLPGNHPVAPAVPDRPGVPASGAVDVTRGCRSGATRARRHDDPVVDLERIAAETVAYFRALDENATLRHHFRHADEEGGLWYFEAVPHRGELVAVKQAELTPAGELHRYSWEHVEDEHGGLTDQAIDPGQDPLETIPAEEFQQVWTR
jgi:hypothetical protein